MKYIVTIHKHWTIHHVHLLTLWLIWLNARPPMIKMMCRRNHFMSVRNNFQGGKGVHLTHLNIRSLWANYDLLNQYLEDSNIACTTISETWLKPDFHTSLVTIANYTLCRLDRQILTKDGLTTKTGGGVAIYVNNNFIFSEKELSHLNQSNDRGHRNTMVNSLRKLYEENNYC